MEVENIDKEIERLEALKKLKSMCEVVEETGAANGSEAVPQRTGQPDGDASVAGCAPAAADGNGYYELKDCKVLKKGDVQYYGEHKDGMIQTIMFEYKPRKGDQMVRICADAWNETLKYNEFTIGDWYDLSLRVGCRESKDGRMYPTVSISFAHRLRVVNG